ncbi:hypothetical protein G6F31_019336 [Rhizopus arrhizus]|nr:hypothetical protein G6F31_019336 [Rhizopus arrhizus]
MSASFPASRVPTFSGSTAMAALRVAHVIACRLDMPSIVTNSSGSRACHSPYGVTAKPVSVPHIIVTPCFEAVDARLRATGQVPPVGDVCHECQRGAAGYATGGQLVGFFPIHAVRMHDPVHAGLDAVNH